MDYINELNIWIISHPDTVFIKSEVSDLNGYHMFPSVFNLFEISVWFLGRLWKSPAEVSYQWHCSVLEKTTCHRQHHTL